MSVPRVKPPWETMYERVRKAQNKGQCGKCARNLTGRGLLEAGWYCRRFWPFGTWLLRDAQHTLAAMKGVRSFDVTTGTQGLGPIKVGTAPLPKSLRGIFWLQDQEGSSAALTFGQGENEGAWTSTGRLVSGNRYRIRVCGENTWAFASSYNIACTLDLIYDFTFNDPDRPTFSQIHPVIGALGGLSTAPVELLADFEMTLAEDGLRDFPGSVVWSRETYSFGILLPAPTTYKLVQIVDEKGARIEPAWGNFSAYQRRVNNDPNVYYRR